ncbi:MAG: LysM peptidoglycan-binding domain-containing protein [Solirubrobacterales bacterium]|nr:LysM peptidoglycan-binding domain-containing protein [Solirubrobacterales bacterium]
MDKKKNSQITRILAVLALAATALILVLTIGGATGGGDDPAKDSGNKPRKQANRPKTKQKTYEVKAGDTLTGIAQKTGIPIARIEKLNPDLDPQALTLGQKLKLR